MDWKNRKNQVIEIEENRFLKTLSLHFSFSLHYQRDFPFNFFILVFYIHFSLTERPSFGLGCHFFMSERFLSVNGGHVLENVSIC